MYPVRDRVTDLIDVVRDQLGIGDYVREEDPRVYVSQRTGRGRLDDDWINETWSECKVGDVTRPGQSARWVIVSKESRVDQM